MKIIVLKSSSVFRFVCFCLFFAVIISVSRFFTVQTDAKETFSSSCGRSLPIYSVQTQEKKAAIGINCAWDDRDIPQILQTLREHNTQATFFLLGEWAEKYPLSAKAITDAGHEIGSHSYSHRDMDCLSQQEILEEIRSSQIAIETVCGKKPILFRPPSGSYNDLVIDSIHSCGCIPIQWNLDTLDWKGLSAKQIAERVSSRLSCGSILLLHSGADFSAQSLPLILEQADDCGFSFVPVGELLLPNSKQVDHEGRQLPCES